VPGKGNSRGGSWSSCFSFVIIIAAGLNRGLKDDFVEMMMMRTSTGGHGGSIRDYVQSSRGGYVDMEVGRAPSLLVKSMN